MPNSLVELVMLETARAASEVNLNPQLSWLSEIDLISNQGGLEVNLTQYDSNNEVALPQYDSGNEVNLPQYQGGEEVLLPDYGWGAEIDLPNYEGGTEIDLPTYEGGDEISLPQYPRTPTPIPPGVEPEHIICKSIDCCPLPVPECIPQCTDLKTTWVWSSSKAPLWVGMECP